MENSNEEPKYHNNNRETNLSNTKTDKRIVYDSGRKMVGKDLTRELVE